MAKAFNEALQRAAHLAKGVQDLTGIIGKPETEKKSLIMVQMFGGPTHPEYLPRLIALQAKHGATITPANYKAIVADLVAMAHFFADNPMVKDRRETQEAIDERERAIKERTEKRDREDAERARALNAAVADLRERYPWAKQDGSSQARLAANLKRLLSDAFPGVLFSCSSDSASMTSSVRVKWAMGPTAKEVAAITAKGAYGTFDGSNDSYNYDHDPAREAWRTHFGEAKYVSENRDLSPALGTVREMLRAHGLEEQGYHGYHEVAYRVLAATRFPAGAVVTGIEDRADAPAEGLLVLWDVPEGAAAPAAPVNGANGITIRENDEKDGVEIHFPNKPDPDTIERVKAAGFRWAKFSRCWYAKRSRYGVREFAYGLAGQPVPAAASSGPADPGAWAMSREACGEA